jgi:hypothetical protein
MNRNGAPVPDSALLINAHAEPASIPRTGSLEIRQSGDIAVKVFRQDGTLRSFRSRSTNAFRLQPVVFIGRSNTGAELSLAAILVTELSGTSQLFLSAHRLQRTRAFTSIQCRHFWLC